jgi:superfamily I DNA/RNA helicase/RecB family exonuclease
MDTAVALTPEQQAVVGHPGPRVLFSGPPGTGKTTTLIARCLRLASRQSASRVAVVCPTRAAADRFLETVLPSLSGGFDAPLVTTAWGLAHDLLTRHGQAVTLLSAAEQREEVARLLAADGPDRWPSAADLLDSPIFVAEVAVAVAELEASGLGDDEVLARAETAGARARWVDLVAFAARYRAALGHRGLLDGAGLLAAATRLLDEPEVAEAEGRRLDHLLVDDAHGCPPGAGRLLATLARLGPTITVATDLGATGAGDDPWAGLDGSDGSARAEPRLTHPFRSPAPPALVTCAHPAVEPEAVAGELLALREQGVAWSDMAVLVRDHGPGSQAFARALARHGIPTQAPASDGRDEPVVQAVLDVLRWVGGEPAALERLLSSPVARLDPVEARAVRRDAAAAGIPLEAHPRLAELAARRAHLVTLAATATPADLAFEVWRLTLGHLVDADGSGSQGADRALDALAGFLDGLARRSRRHPRERLADFLSRHDRTGGEGGSVATDPWRAAIAADRETVTITSIARAAGRQWHTVVVTGCVEGVLPRVDARPHHFEPALLHDPEPPPAAERRRRALAAERRLFALACSRPTHRLVATAAPAPGVLLSRFVEGWPREAVRLPLAPGPAPLVRRPTAGVAPAFLDRRLRLSTSQLATYDDCPLRYGYEYVFGARSEAGVHAGLGSLVHQVLAEFCDPSPANRVPHTREGLWALAEERWRDDIARYRPQVEEARRDYFAMLDGWWEREGGTELAPEVLAVEHCFEVEVGPYRLTGSIDRVDRADDGTGIRIVDYKTGKSEPRAEAVGDDLQLAVYHLAACRDPELAALGAPTQSRLLYLRSMNAFEQPVTTGLESATEARVLALAERILAEDFEPSVEANCRVCSFHRLCPLQIQGRITGVEGR